MVLLTCILFLLPDNYQGPFDGKQHNLSIRKQARPGKLDQEFWSANRYLHSFLLLYWRTHSILWNPLLINDCITYSFFFTSFCNLSVVAYSIPFFYNVMLYPMSSGLILCEADLPCKIQTCTLFFRCQPVHVIEIIGVFTSIKRWVCRPCCVGPVIKTACVVMKLFRVPRKHFFEILYG